ncbi:hypothetical protein [Kitasatospora sp. NPDC093679]|uniref:hypothetical protein n=1 Tax=Kitasatospora sp. NPDC093679 TaxID=3154983 RepID=UPI00341C82AE
MKTHVSNLLAKLQLRTACTPWSSPTSPGRWSRGSRDGPSATVAPSRRRELQRMRKTGPRGAKGRVAPRGTR